MMGMALRHGRRGAAIAGSIGTASGTGLGCIGFTLVMSMLGSGLMGKVMGVEFTLARMGAAMLGNSSGVSNMALVITISEMGTYTLESILRTKCMVLESTNLEMDIGIREQFFQVYNK